MSDGYVYEGSLKRHLPVILKAFKKGQTGAEIAVKIGQPDATALVNYIGVRYGIIAKQKRQYEDTARNVEIAEQYLAGHTSLRRLAAKYGISANRVSQIVERHRQNQNKPFYNIARIKRLEDVPLVALGLSARTQNCFKNNHLTTVGEVMRVPDSELLETPNFGVISLGEWKRRLTALQRRYAKRG
jgi:hypothetical protein